MSEQNVAVVLAARDAWNAGDMQRVGELYHADVVVRAPSGWPEPGPFVGRKAVLEQFARMRETWDEDSLEFVTEPVTVADRVVVRIRWSVVGHGPGPEIELTMLATVRDGLIRDFEYFWEHDDALRAAGVA